MQLEKTIRAAIVSGKIKPDDPLPSEESLCRTYKLSSITVERALRDLAADGLLIRIKGKGTFVRPKRNSSKAALAPPLKKNKTVAMIVPDIEDALIHEVYKGIESVASRNGYLIIVQSSCRDVVKETKNIELLREGMVDGALIFPNWSRFNAAQILSLKNDKFPFVLIDRFFRDIETDTVTVDNVRGAYEGIKHLLDLGHRRIAGIMGVECTAVEDRLEGYLKALQEAGIPYDPALVKKIKPVEANGSIHFEPDERGGYAEAVALIKQTPRPTAIFAANDNLARNCLIVLKDRKIRVPQDIAVLGFDDRNFAAQLDPPLTTVRQPIFEMGAKSMEILLRRIREKSAGKTTPCIHFLLKTKLIIRESTAELIKRRKE